MFLYDTTGKKYYIYEKNTTIELFDIKDKDIDTTLSETDFRWYFEEFDVKYINPLAQKLPFNTLKKKRKMNSVCLEKY